jgi:uncharacterized membrane protein
MKKIIMNKKYIKYIIFLVSLSLFIILSAEISLHAKEKTAATYNALTYAFANYFIYILAGVILGVEQLLFDKRHIDYRFNKTKFIFLTIPFFIIGSLHLISLSELLQLKLNSLFFNELFISLFQIMFGYNLITSFIGYKESKK